MQVLGDLVAEAREREGVLFRVPERTAPYSYGDFAVTAWKTGNLLRHYGVRSGARVAVVAGPKHPGEGDEPGWLGDAPDPLVAFLAATLDGAVVDLDPPAAVDAKAFVAPDAWLDRYERGPGTKTLAYGGPPEDPTVAHMEREAWSENPLAPPAEAGADDAALAADELYSHGDLLTASRRVAEDADVGEDDTVAVRAPVTEPGTVVAGLLAPMRAGATVLLGNGDEAGTVAVASGDAPEERVIDPAGAKPR